MPLAPLIAGNTRGRDHGLRPAFDTELLQDRGDMRLDGRLRHAEFVGDLLVQKTARQHHQHANLLRRQRRQAIAQAAGLRIGGRGHIHLSRNPHLAVEHLLDRVAQFLDAEPLGDKTRRTEIQRAAHGLAIVAGRHNDHRNFRILGAQIDQAGKAADAGHRQIEQHEIGLALLFEQRCQLLERTGFIHLRRRKNARDRFPQCATKQRMIVGDDESINRRRRLHT